MTETPPTPHVSIGTPSGRSFLRFRLSQRAAWNTFLGLCLIAALAWAAIWGAGKFLATTDGAIGSVYELPPGPWGELTAQPLLIEAPKSILSANFRLGNGRWYFAASQSSQVDSLLRSCGLSPGQISTVLANLQPVADLPGLMAVTPSAQLIEELSLEVRSALYDKLALLPQNFAQVEPFRLTDIYLEDWLDAGTLPPEVIARVKSLLWRRGTALLFSDYNLVADSIDSPSLKVELLRQLTRKASLVIKLRVPDHGDVETLVKYWGAGGRTDKVRPLLASVAHSGGASVDISNLLPVFARQRLYRFPDALPGTKDLGPGCHWSSLNFFNRGPTNESLHAPEDIEKFLRQGYVPATDEPRFGDVVMLTMPDGSSIHSAVYIADGIVFTKNGPSLATPFVFSTMADMLAFYPSSEQISLTYYRRIGT